ncbi:hypothetical protein GUJ93_ZPchr0006g42224 [Zizania palustris]|uniref:IBH1-like N-terminal domain-containing protein n=1 Tax=Zizania palustris TaxID=103762 RepID=A0A8J5SBK8_ZIZPA|nr:hypothetical protein GUJ93_ZPchr0006g42224 [Zizania palustris]
MASDRGVLGVQAAGGGGGSGKFKRVLLRNLILGLRKGGVASREMGFHERKDAIKRAADAALASTRGAAPCWSRSLEAELAQQLHYSPGPTNSSGECCKAPPPPTRKMIVCKKIVRRSLRRPRPGNATASSKAYGAGEAGVLAMRAILRKRTAVLKEIVPGGKALDGCTLLGETLDYAVSLKAQVDVMQLLVRALQERKHNSTGLEKQ